MSIQAQDITNEPTGVADALVQALEPLLSRAVATLAVAHFEREGYFVLPQLLSEEVIDRQRRALAPWVERGPAGRNVFEGTRTHRIYAMLAKDPVFCELVAHPVALAWAEHYLGKSCLLSACLAICLGPGESPQPWHTDDGHTSLEAPHEMLGVSTFWALDETTLDNGATEVLPRSHLWTDTRFSGALTDQDFVTADDVDPGDNVHSEAVKVTMPAGSLMIARGDLWHRGGANQTNSPRWIVTPQYCAGWLRPLETMLLSVPPEQAKALPARVRELLGYSIHPPFMGYSDGMHPERALT